MKRREPLTHPAITRKLRVEDPSASYHVMNRGDQREPICKDNVDRQCFVQSLGEASAKTRWQVRG